MLIVTFFFFLGMFKDESRIRENGEDKFQLTYFDSAVYSILIKMTLLSFMW